MVDSLAGRHLLLVLDNCEHLIQAVATLAHVILAGCTQVTLLATSREALMVDGKQTWLVPSLSFRDGNASPAVELFVERARAVAPDFKLGEHGQTVSEICRRLDGIPLAIELAAARVRAMSPAQIRDRLDERLRLLTGGSRRALERHQTLRHAVQWSYDLLSATERTVLSRASVFAGGFTLEAAERVCSGGEVGSFDVLDLLDSLIRKSLVSVERSETVVRYGMLETIRQFGEERLAEMGEGEARRPDARTLSSTPRTRKIISRSGAARASARPMNGSMARSTTCASRSAGRSNARTSTSPPVSRPTSAIRHASGCARRLRTGRRRLSIRHASSSIGAWPCC